MRSHFSPNPGTGPSAALRGRGRIGSDSGLAAGCVAGASSRGGRRGARCGPVVRLLQRAVFLEVGEDGADGGGFLDAGDDPYRAAAVGAGGDVDGKDPLEPLRPAHRTALLLGAARLVVGADVDHFRAQAQEQRAREQRQHEQALQALQVELRQAADQVTAKNAELLRLNRDNGRLLEQTTHQQKALTEAEREVRKAREELESLRPLPAQVTSLEQRTAKAITDAEVLQSHLDQARSQLEQTRRELRDSELERERTQARFEGMQAAWAQRDATLTPATEPVERTGKRRVRPPAAEEATQDLPLK